jgi:hypothetical protein
MFEPIHIGCYGKWEFPRQALIRKLFVRADAKKAVRTERITTLVTPLWLG